MKVSILSCILFLFLVNVVAQEKRNIEINGYVTSMQSVMFDSLKGSFSNDNLLHNRLNLRAYAGNHITFAVELRNRLFTGDMVKGGSLYSEMTGTDPGWVDLSWNILNEQSFFLNTTIDRYWLDLNYGKFQARLGRQRINWGQTLVWNPNDIFNAYSFFDFDYIERPGSDAVRLQYYPSSTSAVEFTIKADSDDDITAAALWRFNRWGYDIQLLAGWVNSEDYVAGAGWSGAIGSTSFRGELSWFEPARNRGDSAGRGIFTIGMDRIFSDNSMAQAQVMYCNDPIDLNGFSTFYSGNLSTKDLAFSRFTGFGQFTYAATPLLSISLSAMWFPDLKGYFAGPAVDLSLSDNLGFSVIWQHFRSRLTDTGFRINLGFLRLKYSF